MDPSSRTPDRRGTKAWARLLRGSFEALGLGLGVWGLGFGVSGFGFRVSGFGFKVRVWGLGFGVSVSGLGFRV